MDNDSPGRSFFGLHRDKSIANFFHAIGDGDHFVPVFLILFLFLLFGTKVVMPISSHSTHNRLMKYLMPFFNREI